MQGSRWTPISQLCLRMRLISLPAQVAALMLSCLSLACRPACSALQVWVLGQSPEFGYCKATKKVLYCMVLHGTAQPCMPPTNRRQADLQMYPASRSRLSVSIHQICRCPACLPPAFLQNGDPCRMPVNASRCPFCPFHVQASASAQHMLLLPCRSACLGGLAACCQQTLLLATNPMPPLRAARCTPCPA